MKQRILATLLLAAAAPLTLTVQAQTLVPKWNVNTIGANQIYANGIGYVPSSGNVIVSMCAGATPTIYRFQSSDGASAGGNLSVAGISGGALAVGGLAVGTDGVIYACNYGGSGTTQKIYSWANEDAAPVNFYSGAYLGNGSVGKNLAVYGTGNGAVFLLSSTGTGIVYVYWDGSAWVGKQLTVVNQSCQSRCAIVDWSPTACHFITKNSAASGYYCTFDPSAGSPITVTQTAISGWPAGGGTIHVAAYDPVTKLIGTHTRTLAASPYTITVGTWSSGAPLTGSLTAPTSQSSVSVNCTAADSSNIGCNCWGDGMFFVVPEVGNTFGLRAYDTTAFMVSDITPTTQTKTEGDPSASFTVVSGGSSLTYTWKHNGTTLTAGPKYSGLNTGTLTINSLTADDAGTYTCVVTQPTVAGGTTWTSGNGVLNVGISALLRTWNGAGANDNWSSANWQEGALDLSGDSLRFAGSTRLTPYMDNSYTVTGIEFQNGADSFTIGAAAGKTLTLGGDITQNSSSDQALNVPIALSATRAINAAVGNLALGGAISGTGAGLTKSGTGMLTLGAVNTYDGATAINAGTVKLGVAQSLPSGAGKGNVSLAGTLDLAGNSQTLNGLSGGGFIDNSVDNGVTSLVLGGNNQSSAFSGQIKNTVGKVALTKIGTGTVALGGSLSYSGDTTNSAGTISIGSGTFFGDETGTLRLAGGKLLMTGSHGSSTSFDNPVQMSADTTFQAAPSSGTWYIRFGSSSLSFDGGTLTVTNAGNQSTTTFVNQWKAMGGVTFGRPIFLSAGTRLELCDDDQVNGSLISGQITGAGIVNYTCWGTGTGGSTVVTGNNTYSGGSQLSGGFLGFGASSTGSPLTAGPIGTGTLTVNNDPLIGVFASGAARQVGNPITFATLTDNHAFQIKGEYDLTLSGNMALGNSNRTFQVDNTGVTTFSGAISGGAAGKTLTKTGNGTLVFSGNNTYTIPTAISSGTFLVNNTAGSGTGSGALTVDSAVLGGTGSIGGPVTLNWATVAPGTTSAGRLTFQGGVDLTFATLEWDLAANSTSNPGTDFDQLAVTGGNVVLGGYSTLKLKFSGTATVPNDTTPFWQNIRTWKVVNVSGAGANPGDSNFASIQGAEAVTAGTFATSVDSTGSVILTWTPNVIIAEPIPVTSFSIAPGTGGQLNLSYSGGSGTQFVLLQTNNLAAPMELWTRVQTNYTSPNTFIITPGSDPAQFYRVKSE